MKSLELKNYEILNDMILLKWNDGSENVLSLKSLRNSCPCAHCSGETDVFGNIYKGPEQILNEDSYVITGIQPVGYYAIRPFWKDQHKDGIFSYEFLKRLCDKYDKT